MKRLFGLIGIVYLCTLTAVFYFKSSVFIAVVLFIAAAIICAGIVFKIKRNRYMFKTMLIAGITVCFAVLSIFLYQNYYIDLIVNNYSDKEITVEGYVCEEITFKEKSAEYLIQTERINGNPVNTKIRYTGYSENEIKEFDKVTLNVTASADTNNRNISRRILLRAFEKEPDDITGSGESKFSLYKYAIEARKDIRKALGRLMTKDGAALSCAVLLGDKNELPDSIYGSFKKTGTSYLIVVSGLHLSIALTLITSLIKKFTRRRVPLCIGAILAVICFAAITGFNYSVIRAAIAIVIYQIGRIFLKNADPMNSLGLAAFAMTILNPCAVGDLGLLMSFASTAGIILWADKINDFITKKAKVNKLPQGKIKSAVYFLIDLLSVSISATLWIIPINIIAMGRITPLVVIVSLITEPIASAILVLSLFCSLSYLFPVVPILTQLAAYANDLLCQLLIFINNFFAGLPASTIKTDGFLVFAWLGITAAMVAVGYIIKAKKNYVIASINISFALMIIFVAVSFLTADTSSKITVYQSGKGVSIEVCKEGNVSLLSLGGNNKNFAELYEDLNRGYYEIDNIIIPNSNYYSEFLPSISEEFKINNILTNADSYEDVKLLSDKKPYIIEDNTVQTVRLNTNDNVDIISSNGVVYQYLKSESNSVLFVPRYGKISDLPKEYKTADYVILDSTTKSASELDCETIIYTYFDNEITDSLHSLCDNFIELRNDKIEIK